MGKSRHKEKTKICFVVGRFISFLAILSKNQIICKPLISELEHTFNCVRPSWRHAANLLCFNKLISTRENNITFKFQTKRQKVTQARPHGMKSNCNYKIDHGSISVASCGILSAGPFQNSFTAGDDAQGCCRGRGRGQNSRERRLSLEARILGSNTG